MIIFGFPVVFACFVKATPDNRRRSLLQWVELAGVKNYSFMPEGTWGVLLPMDSFQAEWSVANLSVDCCLENYGNYLCFQIFASKRDVSDYGLPPQDDRPGVTLEEYRALFREEPSFYKDPRVQIAEDFARACVAMDAEVGVYTTSWHYKPVYREVQEWLKEYVYDRAIRIGDVRALLQTDTKIFFLNDAWYNLMLEKYPDFSLQELLWVTDVIPDMPKPGYHGALLFNGSGRYRF